MPSFFKKSSTKSPSSVAMNNGNTVSKSIIEVNTSISGGANGSIGESGETGGAGGGDVGGSNYRVQIPSHIQPGQEFQATVGSRIVRVWCPENSKGGDFIMITLPPNPIKTQTGPPQSTLNLWTRVGANLKKSKTVVWKDALASFQAAMIWYLSSEASRHFVTQCAGDIVNIFLNQSPSRIGAHEKHCVNKSLELAAKLVIVDLKWRMSVAPDAAKTSNDEIDQEMATLSTMTVSQLKSELEQQYGISTQDFVEKSDFTKALAAARVEQRCGGQSKTAGGSGLAPGDSQNECMLLDSVLKNVFDKKKTYFKQAGGWGNPQGRGLPEVRLQCISAFSLSGGFRKLSEYLEKHKSNTSISLETIQVIIGALNDIRSSNSPGSQSNKGKGVPGEECLELANAVFACLREKVSDSNVKAANLVHLGSIFEELCKIFDHLSTTQFRQSSIEFYTEWPDFCLQLVMSNSPPFQLAGWEQLKKLVRAVELHRPPPRQYIVSGAGVDLVNGTYNFAGPISESGYAEVGAEVSYAKEIPGGAGRKNKKLTIFRCTMRSQKKNWFLSEPDPERPGTDRDIDYYQHKCDGGKYEEDFPPSSGWISCGRGSNPPPHLEAKGLMVADNDSNVSMEDNLAKWLLDRNIFETYFEKDKIYPAAVKASKEFIIFIAERNCLNETHMLLAWRTIIRNKASKYLLKELCHLASALLPMLSTECSSAFILSVTKTQQQLVDDGGDKIDHFHIMTAISTMCSSLVPRLDDASLSKSVKENISTLITLVAEWNDLQTFSTSFVADKNANEEGPSTNTGFVETPVDNDLVRYAGLVNLGSTGYIDVILQQLFMCPKFRDFVVSLSLPDDGAVGSVDVRNYLRLTKEFQNIFLHLNAALETPTLLEADSILEGNLRQGLPCIRSFLGTYDPSKFVEACSGGTLGLEHDMSEQNDAAEFLSKLLDRVLAVLSSFGSPDNLATFNDLTTAKMARQKICQCCSLTTNHINDIMSISCPVRGKKKLSESLSYIVDEEIMAGANAVYCKVCDMKTDTVLKSGIVYLPELLVMD